MEFDLDEPSVPNALAAAECHPTFGDRHARLRIELGE